MFPTMRAQELKQIVHTDSIRFIDCRYSLNDASYGKSVYRKGHLPNAVFLDLMEDCPVRSANTADVIHFLRKKHGRQHFVASA